MAVGTKRSRRSQNAAVHDGWQDFLQTRFPQGFQLLLLLRIWHVLPIIADIKAGKEKAELRCLAQEVILLAPSLFFIWKTLVFIERCVGEWCVVPRTGGQCHDRLTPVSRSGPSFDGGSRMILVTPGVSFLWVGSLGYQENRNPDKGAMLVPRRKVNPPSEGIPSVGSRARAGRPCRRPLPWVLVLL